MPQYSSAAFPLCLGNSCSFEFRDINPVAPTHVLIIPKRRDGLTQLRHATADHVGVLGHMLEVAASIAIQEKLEGYRCCLCTGYGLIPCL